MNDDKPMFLDMDTYTIKLDFYYALEKLKIIDLETLHRYSWC